MLNIKLKSYNSIFFLAIPSIFTFNNINKIFILFINYFLITYNNKLIKI